MATAAPTTPITHTAYTAGDWITRDDMALLARCSVDTVRREERKLNAKFNREPRTDEAGRALVNVGEFIELGRIRPEDLTLGTSPAESAAIIRSRQAETELREQSARLRGELDQAETVLATLREQLAVKDKQLAKRDEQITQLTTLLSTSLGRFHAAGGAA